MRTLLITLFISCLFAQAQENKLQYHGFYQALSLHPFNTDDYGGLAGYGFGASFDLNEHIFRVHATVAISPLFFVSETSYGYQEIALLYGREYKLSERLSADVFTGVAYFNFDNGNDIKTASLSLPIQTSIRYRFKNKVSMGLVYGFNANAHKSHHRIGLLFNWKPNRSYKTVDISYNEKPSTKLQYHSFHIAGGTVYPYGKAGYIPVSGPTWAVTFKEGKHFLKYRVAVASGTQPVKSEERVRWSGFFSFPSFSEQRDHSEYRENTLLYGREFKPLRRVTFKGFTGVAHIAYTNQHHNIDTKQLGAALSTTLDIFLTKTFAIGIHTGLTLSDKRSNHYWSAGITWNAKQFKYFQS